MAIFKVEDYDDLLSKGNIVGAKTVPETKVVEAPKAPKATPKTTAEVK